MTFRKLTIPAVLLVTLFANFAFAQAEEVTAAPEEAAAEPVAPAEKTPAVEAPTVEAEEMAPVENAPEEEVAEPAAVPAAAPTEEEEAKSYGVNIDFGFATIYNFRGYNSFQDSSQQDRHAAFFPSITWGIGDTGLYVGYWGAYQMSGNNKTAMVEGALGHEQDLYVGWDKSFGPDEMLTFSAAFTYFFYPFATATADNGDEIGNPSIIEPLVGLGVSSFIDFGLSLSFFAGVDDSTKPLTHLYIKPTIGKSFSFGERFGMDLGFGAGFKVWTDDDMSDAGENTVDLTFDAALPIALEGSLYLAPAISMAWTNLDQITETDAAGVETTRDAHVGDEYMIYGSLNIGADF